MPFRTVEENLRAAMRCYSRVSPQGEAREYPGLVLASTGMNCAVFNSAMLTGCVGCADLKQLVGAAHLHFHQRSLGWTFWLCEDLLNGSNRNAIRSVFRELGMAGIAQAPGMYAERLRPPSRPLAELTVRKVSDDTTRLDFAHLSSVIFSLPFKVSREVYGSPALWDGAMTGWVGYYAQVPVSLVSVVIAADAAGVYSLGTLPEFQRRGFGETILRHALSRAHEETGYETTVLQATRQGFNLYSRMGYRVVTQFAVYLHEGCNGF